MTYSDLIKNPIDFLRFLTMNNKWVLQNQIEYWNTLDLILKRLNAINYIKWAKVTLCFRSLSYRIVYSKIDYLMLSANKK